MLDIQLTPEFDRWLSGVRDVTTRARITARLRQAGMGHLGGLEVVGAGAGRDAFALGAGVAFVFHAPTERVDRDAGGGRQIHASSRYTSGSPPIETLA